MGFNLEPVRVSIGVETNTLSRDAFYNLCFITNNEEAPRTLKVERLKDLLDNGYDRSSLAYNFCVGVFAQQSIPFVYIRAKRAAESYEEAFSADDNNNYYYVVIESKELYEISEFNKYLVSVDDFKLQFHSSNSEDLWELSGDRIVSYYQEVLYSGSDEDFYIDSSYKTVEPHNYSTPQYPMLVENRDHYTPEVKPLDITLREVLKSRFFEDGYTPSVTPLDILMERVFEGEVFIDEGVETYIPTVTPLDITLKRVLSDISQDPREAYTPSVKPLDITLEEVLVQRWVDSNEAYTPSVKPLDITLKKW